MVSMATAYEVMSGDRPGELNAICMPKASAKDC